MLHWNVLFDIHEHGFSRAYLLLKELGTVYLSDFDNILLLEVNSIPQFLETLKRMIAKDSSLSRLFSLVVPVTTTFEFQTPAEFETKAQEVILSWLPSLAGKSFYVRIHRRGFKGIIDTHHEAGFLDRMILEQLEKMGHPGQIMHEDPDALINVEIVGKHVGLSCWTYEDLQRFPVIKLG
ncbi:MAG: hypothetical protein AAFW67_04970 [Cyanobacteria bacterium J06638_38]